MPRKIRQLKRDLRRAGADKVHEKGDHEKWRHPLVPDYYVELSGADGDDAKRYQEQHVRELLRRIQRAVEK
ncbi:MAG TPA: hypothetical protein VIC27_10695 [Ktedonobacterales bacterium]|jgi:hypothetical protein